MDERSKGLQDFNRGSPPPLDASFARQQEYLNIDAQYRRRQAQKKEADYGNQATWTPTRRLVSLRWALLGLLLGLLLGVVYAVSRAALLHFPDPMVARFALNWGVMGAFVGFLGPTLLQIGKWFVSLALLIVAMGIFGGLMVWLFG